jgi:mono/diheme cytochrome c family protein
MWQPAVFALRILTALPGAAFLVLHLVPHGLAQNGGMTESGCMGMNCMGTPGAGRMRGMGGGSMPRHRQLMMGGVPEPYASMANPLPDTAPVIARGRAVFEQSCASCHGAEGRGNGEAGRELSPPPADLAMLVRMPMMRDDRYLFWTISEGGAAFGTAMPASKDSLSDEEIWSVIRFLQGGLPPK